MQVYIARYPRIEPGKYYYSVVKETNGKKKVLCSKYGLWQFLDYGQHQRGSIFETVEEAEEAYNWYKQPATTVEKVLECWIS